MTSNLLRVPVPGGWSSTSDAPAEFLITNGLGGYAFGTLAGPPMRRFHGWLVAALPAPFGRTMLLHAVDETVRVAGRPPVRLAGLTTQAEVPSAFALVGGLPVWHFTLPDGVLERAMVMPHGANTVHVRYRWLGEPAVSLVLRPWLDVRPHHAELMPDRHPAYAAHLDVDGLWHITLDGLTVLRMTLSAPGTSCDDDRQDARAVRYEVERARGYDWVGSAYSPGTVGCRVDPGHEAWFTATHEPAEAIRALPPTAAWDAELARREHLVALSHPSLQSSRTFLLPLAADQFIIRPIGRPVDTVRVRAAGGEPRSVIAGYPWFTDWGRDTMISLEGLTLATGRFSEARDILQTFALHVRDGLIPNLFPEGEQTGLYHTADATLWFFHALDRYERISGDATLVDELLPVLQRIVEAHVAGTVFGIGVEPDGLLTQGTATLPLTWMDARMGDWVVTPRRGKPVEINALWHNALRLMADWLHRNRIEASAIRRHADRCERSFTARFWNDRRGCLFDVVDGEAGDDPAIRPNQVLAVAVAHSPLDPARWAAVVETVASQLLTPVGLRTLAAGEPAYRAQYAGDLEARDGAYHQGTAWPWLIGPFVDAWLRVHGPDAAEPLLEPLLEHLLAGACVGSVSEIFDPEPPYLARGCVAQAWSVAELTRLVVPLAPTRRSPPGTGPLHA